MFLAHKIELRPTKEQEQYFRKSCGISRLIYNKCLDYSKKNKWNKKEILKYLQNELRSEFPFITEVSSRISRTAVEDLENSYKRFFNKIGKYPVFKKRKENESFSIREKEKFDVNGRLLRIEKLKSKIKMRNKLRFEGIPKQITISFQGGKWFASVLVDTEIKSRNPRDEVVGVDLGIKTLATLSNGVIFENPKFFRSKQVKLKKLQQKFCRQVKESSGWYKTKAKINKLHYYISEQRKAYLHELTSYLVSNFKTIVIEDLFVEGMIKNRKLSKSIIDSGFGMFREMLTYKCKLYGNKLIVVDRWFPSSKTCSNCGCVKEDLRLSDRIYKCECGYIEDRDVNASINLKNMATGLATYKTIVEI
jgi:putative transposase